MYIYIYIYIHQLVKQPPTTPSTPLSLPHTIRADSIQIGWSPIWSMTPSIQDVSSKDNFWDVGGGELHPQKKGKLPYWISLILELHI